METILNKFSDNQTNKEIKGLLLGIHNTTIQMNNTFQQAIVRHQEQFIKTYRTKITELTKLFQELTKVIQDKFINNALTNRLQIVLKQRDYFKYQCLKLNMQYQTIQGQQNTMASQITNVIQQMNIYKHLLEDQKLKNNSLQENITKIKNNFSNLAYKSLTETAQNVKTNDKSKDDVDYQKMKKKLQSTSSQLRQKQQTIRHQKIKISQLQNKIYESNLLKYQHKQLYDVFKTCVNSWKRDLLTKQRGKYSKDQSQTRFSNKTHINLTNMDKISTMNKKQLLKYFFTSSQFLDFIQKLLFSNHIQISFIEHDQADNDGEGYMIKNRKKLFDYMRKKKIMNSPLICQMR